MTSRGKLGKERAMALSEAAKEFAGIQGKAKQAFSLKYEK